MSGTLPYRETAPTDRRGGEEIEPSIVECPFCGSEGVTDSEVNLCGCGRWFAVETEGDAS